MELTHSLNFIKSGTSLHQNNDEQEKIIDDVAIPIDVFAIKVTYVTDPWIKGLIVLPVKRKKDD